MQLFTGSLHAILDVKLLTHFLDTELFIQDQAGSFTFELWGENTSGTYLNIPPWVVGYHLKAFPKSLNHCSSIC